MNTVPPSRLEKAHARQIREQLNTAAIRALSQPDGCSYTTIAAKLCAEYYARWGRYPELKEPQRRMNLNEVGVMLFSIVVIVMALCQPGWSLFKIGVLILFSVCLIPLLCKLFFPKTTRAFKSEMEKAEQRRARERLMKHVIKHIR